MNSYYAEFHARDRIAEWHGEAEGARQVRLVRGKGRRSKSPFARKVRRGEGPTILLHLPGVIADEG